MTICLCMIVRNEARGIVRTLESVKPYVDRWVIVDTGSTDDTKALVLETMHGLPGTLHTAEFVDFSTTRNLALDLAEREPGWTLMLSGDAVLESGIALRELVRRADESGTDAVQCTIRRTGDGHDQTYPQAILTRNGAGCRYEYPTHELLVVPADAKRANADQLMLGAPRVHYTVQPGGSRERWAIDLQLLSAYLDTHPRDPRACFYYAQTLECLGQDRLAAAVYLGRHFIEEGNQEERFLSLLRRGRCQWRMNLPTEEIERSFRDAHAFHPDRAEPLYELANVYWGRGDIARALEVAREAAAIPYPSRPAQFVEREKYLYAPQLVTQLEIQAAAANP